MSKGITEMSGELLNIYMNLDKNMIDDPATLYIIKHRIKEVMNLFKEYSEKARGKGGRSDE